MRFIVTVFAAIIGLAGVVLVMGSAYIVDEGRVAVITSMGKATHQEGPDGLQFKKPIITGVKEFDVRERAINVTLTGATFDQLPSTLEVSVNWRPDPTRVMEIFVEYGSPNSFAVNTIIPRLQQSLKATVGRFSGADLTRKREEVAQAMLTNAKNVLAQYPAILSSVQIEDFDLPPRYMEAVLQKQEQREATEREQLRLEQQRFEAQREVQSAEAARDARKANADGNAYAVEVEAQAEAQAIRVKAEAEADGIRAKAEAMENLGRDLIEYERVKTWNGVLPVTVMGDQPELLMQMPQQ